MLDQKLMDAMGNSILCLSARIAALENLLVEKKVITCEEGMNKFHMIRDNIYDNIEQEVKTREAIEKPEKAPGDEKPSDDTLDTEKGIVSDDQSG